MYDALKERRVCFFVLCDIIQMISINEISYKAGDLAILEQMRRMTSAAGEEDIVFRIGGDEFCILTASNEISYAQRIADRIRRIDGQTFLYEDQEIPLVLHVAVANIQECHRYEDVFAGLHKALRAGKSS